MIALNSKAPSIELNTDTEWFSLKNNLGKKIIVFFFPRADTSGCTAESIEFSTFIKEFKALNTIVIGISKDTPEKQKKFKKKYDLNCILGADNETDVCERYGVWVEKSMYGKKYWGIQRSTFLIDETGKIIHIWPKVKVPNHAKDVLETVKNLN